MTRLIEVDMALKHIDDYYGMLKRIGKPSKGMYIVVQSIKTIINSLQTVDTEPVIRCEECSKNGKLNCPMAYWDMETGEITWWNKPGEYCSRAERKEENGK